MLTVGEVNQILAQPDRATHQGKRDRALLELLYSSGLRLAEVTALGIHDLDLSGGFVRVARGKGGRGRVVPLGTSAVEALSAYLGARRVWLETRGQMEAALWLSPIRPHGPLRKEAVALVARRCAVRAAGRHRVLVMSQGSISAELTDDQVTEDWLLSASQLGTSARTSLPGT